MLSTVYNMFHWRREQVNLYYISTQLFAPATRTHRISMARMRYSVSTSNFPLSKIVFIYVFACLGERFSQIQEPFVSQRE